MNFLQALRLHNIFGPANMVGNDLPSQGGITGNMPVQPPMFNPQPPPVDDGGGSNGVDVNALFNQYYQPEHTAEDAYNRMIQQYPVDRGHSRLARIGAAIAGGLDAYDNGIGHGFALGNSILDEPRKGDIEDWKNQVGPMQRAADLERYENTNRRNLANQQVSQILKDKGQELKDKQDTRKSDIAQERTDILRLKAQNPNLRFDTSGATIKVMDPKTGQITDTHVATNKLSEIDKLSLQHRYRDEEIDRRATEAVKPPVMLTGPDGVTRSYVPLPNGKFRPISEADIVSGDQGNKPTPAAGTPSANAPSQAPDTTALPTGGVPSTQGGAANPPANNPTPGGFQVTTAAIQTQKAAARQAEFKQQQGLRNLTQNTLDEIDQLVDPVTGKLTEEAEAAVGPSRFLDLGGYNPIDYKTKTGALTIQRTKALLIEKVLGEMKAQSRTGATGFGQLNMKELDVIDKAASKLDPAMGEEAFLREIKSIQEKLRKIMQPPDGSTDNPGSPTSPTAGMSAADRIAHYRGLSGGQ